MQSIKQKEKKSFSSFFPKFKKELADTGLANGLDAVKIGYLKAAINE